MRRSTVSAAGEGHRTTGRCVYRAESKRSITRFLRARAGRGLRAVLVERSAHYGSCGTCGFEGLLFERVAARTHPEPPISAFRASIRRAYGKSDWLDSSGHSVRIEWLPSGTPTRRTLTCATLARRRMREQVECVTVARLLERHGLHDSNTSDRCRGIDYAVLCGSISNTRRHRGSSITEGAARNQ